MKCPACKSESKMRCIRTRYPEPTVTRRTYLCDSCDKRFFSTEILDDALPGGRKGILRKPRKGSRAVVPGGSVVKGKDPLAGVEAVLDDDDGEWDDFEEDWEDGEDFWASGGADWYDGDDDWDNE
jgi:hypothetical protein